MKKKPFIANWEETITYNGELSSICTRTINDHDPNELGLGFVETILTEAPGESDPDELC